MVEIALVSLLYSTLKDLSRLLTNKLLEQPGLADEKLGIALKEVYRTNKAIDNELASYISLYKVKPRNPEELQGDLAILQSLTGGKVKARIEKARGHCSRIDDIYRSYIQGNLQSLLNKHLLNDEEYTELDSIFTNLSNCDGFLMGNIEKLGDSLDSEAKEVIQLIMDGKYIEANNKIRIAFNEIDPKRREINDLMAAICKRYNQFTKIKRIT